MSQKVPVIVSDQVDMITDIKKNNAALICKCEVDSIYKSIQFLINNKKYSKSMVNQAYKFVKKNYNSTNIEKLFFKNYR